MYAFFAIIFKISFANVKSLFLSRFALAKKCSIFNKLTGIYGFNYHDYSRKCFKVNKFGTCYTQLLSGVAQVFGDFNALSKVRLVKVKNKS